MSSGSNRSRGSSRPGGLGPAVLAAVGLLGLVGWMATATTDAEPEAWAGLLVAVLAALSVALGALFFVLVHFLARSGWSVLVRRQAEHLAGALPALALLMLLPLTLGLPALYEWSDAALVAGDPVLSGKAVWLEPGFFRARAVLYLLTWSCLGWWFRRRSVQQDRSGDPDLTRRMQEASAPALIAFGLTVTFASFDWIMSLEPHWYSAIFGVYFFAGCAVAGLAGIVLLLPGGTPAGREQFHDLGKLLFGFLVFWAYIGFSQFLLIWYAAIPEETSWYAARLTPGWRDATLALALGHFIVPFFLLLSAAAKRRRPVLQAAAAWLLGMHVLDLYWLVMPTFRDSWQPGLADLLALAGTCALFAAVVWQLARGAQPYPVRDPRLPESLARNG